MCWLTGWYSTGSKLFLANGVRPPRGYILHGSLMKKEGVRRTLSAVALCIRRVLSTRDRRLESWFLPITNSSTDTSRLLVSVSLQGSKHSALASPRKKVKTNHQHSKATGAGPTNAATLQQLSIEHLSASRQVPDLPFEVFGEIFKLLHPRDLLNVSRTSKNISRFVLHRDQEYIWRHGRERFQGIPKCPSFLSERAFAHFLFAPFCHCSPKVQYVGSDAIAALYDIGQYIRDNEDWRGLFNVLDPGVDFKANTNRIQRRQLDKFARD
ncbi:hypothetical protein C8Q74DRAFT_573115 [Fomes fomentarius]|nr:hypothetical protein C8Q74DRAFT_573115 [Fomes fomentarius]